jgi:YegS/Rv2252/BmrU family lipid kinase
MSGSFPQTQRTASSTSQLSDEPSNPTISPSIEVIVNAASGASDEAPLEELKAAFSNARVSARFHLLDPSDIPGSIDPVVQSGGSTIVAAGGDGTISAVAGAVSRADKVLGVLPMGTLNNFSKDLGIPQELEAAVRVIADGHTRRIDLGSVNGRLFINNSSIGLYPRIVKHREKQQRLGRGKWWAAAWAALRVLKYASFMRVKLSVEGKELSRKTPFLFVGNNAYQMDLYNIGRRETLDDGLLSVYLIRHYGRLGVLSLILRTLVGTLRQSKDFEEMRTADLTIEMRRPRALVAADGEVVEMETPLRYRIEPGALTVIAPRQGD